MGKGKIFHGDRAKNAAVNAQIEILTNARLVADAAADLNFQAAEFCNGGDGLHIRGGVILGAIQVNDVQILRTCVDKLLRLGHWIGVVDGHLVVIALIQPHGLAAAQVNSGV